MQRKQLAVLIAAGVTSEVIYLLAFVLPAPLAQYYAVPRLGLGSLHGGPEALAYLGGMVALFGLYVVAGRAARALGRDRAALAIVLGFALLFGATLVAAYPRASVDVFAYVFQGRVLAEHHANPFVATPASLPGDSVVPYLFWLEEPSHYGPLWVLLSGAAAVLYGDNLLLGLIAFKAVGVIFYLLAAVLVYLILRRRDAGAAVGGAAFLAWNPLVAFESAFSGHNDVAMAALALLAAYALIQGRARLAFPLLMASALVKYATLVLFPVLLVSWLRSAEPRGARSRSALVGLALAVLLAAGAFAPFWEGLRSLGPLNRGELFTASPAALAFYLLSALGYDARQPVMAGALFLFSLFSVARLLRMRPGTEHLLMSCFDLLFAYLVLAAFWFQPWYLVPLVACAAALTDPFRRRLAVLFSAGAMLDYFIFYLGFTYPQALGFLQLQALLVGAMFVPPLVVLLTRLPRSSRSAIIPSHGA